eukprot:8464441-Pyramimonas_sp.AAC.2
MLVINAARAALMSVRQCPFGVRSERRGRRGRAGPVPRDGTAARVHARVRKLQVMCTALRALAFSRTRDASPDPAGGGQDVDS